MASGFSQLVVCDGGSPPEKRDASRAIANVDGGSSGLFCAVVGERKQPPSRGLPEVARRRIRQSGSRTPADLFVVVDRANLDHEITMKYYFNDYLIPKLKDIIKILLFNGNKIFWEDFPRF